METGQQSALRSALPARLTKHPLFPHMDILADIQREWDLAETAVKRCEQVANDAVIPAINELRYAGRRIIDALNAAQTPGNEAKVAAYLEDARFNCHRARHDAMDAALDVIARDFDNLTKRLGYDAVTRAFPGFSDLYASFALARSKIAASRGDRENRDAIYKSIEDVDFPGIADRYAALLTCKPIALSFAACNRAQRIGFWVMLGIATSSLFATALNYYVNSVRVTPMPELKERSQH